MASTSPISDQEFRRRYRRAFSNFIIEIGKLGPTPLSSLPGGEDLMRGLLIGPIDESTAIDRRDQVSIDGNSTRTISMDQIDTNRANRSVDQVDQSISIDHDMFKKSTADQAAISISIGDTSIQSISEEDEEIDVVTIDPPTGNYRLSDQSIENGESIDQVQESDQSMDRSMFNRSQANQLSIDQALNQLLSIDRQENHQESIALPSAVRLQSIFDHPSIDDTSGQSATNPPLIRRSIDISTIDQSNRHHRQIQSAIQSEPTSSTIQSADRQQIDRSPMFAYDRNIFDQLAKYCSSTKGSNRPIDTSADRSIKAVDQSINNIDQSISTDQSLKITDHQPMDIVADQSIKSTFESSDISTDQSIKMTNRRSIDTPIDRSLNFIDHPTAQSPFVSSITSTIRIDNPDPNTAAMVATIERRRSEAIRSMRLIRQKSMNKIYGRNRAINQKSIGKKSQPRHLRPQGNRSMEKEPNRLITMDDGGNRSMDESYDQSGGNQHVTSTDQTLESMPIDQCSEDPILINRNTDALELIDEMVEMVLVDQAGNSKSDDQLACSYLSDEPLEEEISIDRMENSTAMIKDTDQSILDGDQAEKSIESTDQAKKSIESTDQPSKSISPDEIDHQPSLVDRIENLQIPTDQPQESISTSQIDDHAIKSTSVSTDPCDGSDQNELNHEASLSNWMKQQIDRYRSEESEQAIDGDSESAIDDDRSIDQEDDVAAINEISMINGNQSMEDKNMESMIKSVDGIGGINGHKKAEPPEPLENCLIAEVINGQNRSKGDQCETDDDHVEEIDNREILIDGDSEAIDRSVVQFVDKSIGQEDDGAVFADTPLISGNRSIDDKNMESMLKSATAIDGNERPSSSEPLENCSIAEVVIDGRNQSKDAQCEMDDGHDEEIDNHDVSIDGDRLIDQEDDGAVFGDISMVNGYRSIEDKNVESMMKSANAIDGNKRPASSEPMENESIAEVVINVRNESKDDQCETIDDHTEEIDNHEVLIDGVSEAIDRSQPEGSNQAIDGDRSINREDDGAVFANISMVNGGNRSIEDKNMESMIKSVNAIERPPSPESAENESITEVIHQDDHAITSATVSIDRSDGTNRDELDQGKSLSCLMEEEISIDRAENSAEMIKDQSILESDQAEKSISTDQIDHQPSLVDRIENLPISTDQSQESISAALAPHCRRSTSNRHKPVSFSAYVRSVRKISFSTGQRSPVFGPTEIWTDQPDGSYQNELNHEASFSNSMDQQIDQCQSEESEQAIDGDSESGGYNGMAIDGVRSIDQADDGAVINEITTVNGNQSIDDENMESMLKSANAIDGSERPTLLVPVENESSAEVVINVRNQSKDYQCETGDDHDEEISNHEVSIDGISEAINGSQSEGSNQAIDGDQSIDQEDDGAIFANISMDDGNRSIANNSMESTIKSANGIERSQSPEPMVNESISQEINVRNPSSPDQSESIDEHIGKIDNHDVSIDGHTAAIGVSTHDQYETADDDHRNRSIEDERTESMIKSANAIDGINGNERRESPEPMEPEPFTDVINVRNPSTADQSESINDHIGNIDNHDVLIDGHTASIGVSTRDQCETADDDHGNRSLKDIHTESIESKSAKSANAIDGNERPESPDAMENESIDQSTEHFIDESIDQPMDRKDPDIRAVVEELLENRLLSEQQPIDRSSPDTISEYRSPADQCLEHRLPGDQNLEESYVGDGSDGNDQSILGDHCDQSISGPTDQQHDQIDRSISDIDQSISGPTDQPTNTNDISSDRSISIQKSPRLELSIISHVIIGENQSESDQLPVQSSSQSSTGFDGSRSILDGYRSSILRRNLKRRAIACASRRNQLVVGRMEEQSGDGRKMKKRKTDPLDQFILDRSTGESSIAEDQPVDQSIMDQSSIMRHQSTSKQRTCQLSILSTGGSIANQASANQRSSYHSKLYGRGSLVNPRARDQSIIHQSVSDRSVKMTSEDHESSDQLDKDDQSTDQSITDHESTDQSMEKSPWKRISNDRSVILSGDRSTIQSSDQLSITRQSIQDQRRNRAITRYNRSKAESLHKIEDVVNSVIQRVSIEASGNRSIEEIGDESMDNDQAANGESTDQIAMESGDQSEEHPISQPQEESIIQESPANGESITQESPIDIADHRSISSYDQSSGPSTDQLAEPSIDQSLDTSIDQVTKSSTDQSDKLSADQSPKTSTDQMTKPSIDQVTKSSTDHSSKSSIDRSKSIPPAQFGAEYRLRLRSFVDRYSQLLTADQELSANQNYRFRTSTTNGKDQSAIGRLSLRLVEKPPRLPSILTRNRNRSRSIDRLSSDGDRSGGTSIDSIEEPRGAPAEDYGPPEGVYFDQSSTSITDQSDPILDLSFDQEFNDRSHRNRSASPSKSATSSPTKSSTSGSPTKRRGRQHGSFRSPIYDILIARGIDIDRLRTKETIRCCLCDRSIKIAVGAQMVLSNGFQHAMRHIQLDEEKSKWNFSAVLKEEYRSIGMAFVDCFKEDIGDDGGKEEEY